MMTPVQKISRSHGGIITALAFFLFVFSANSTLFAQCGITCPSQNLCAGTITFNASSAGSTVSNHTWYQADGVTPVSTGVVTQVGIDYDNNGVRDAWTSKYVVSLSNNATFWVKPNCSTPAIQVNFTLDAGSNVNIVMTPAIAMPDNLCAGESITLSTTGNTPQWRFNNPNDPSYIAASSRVATQTGTYYLRAWNSCNVQQDRSVYLEFKPVMSGIAIAPGSETLCEGTVQTQYTAQGYNYQFLTWSITDDDLAANATINSSTGLVTWNGMKGNATVSMTATGCHSTTVTPTAKSVYVTPKPTLTQCALSAATASDIFNCSAPQLSIQSVSSYVNSHKWYTTQNGIAEVPITETVESGGVRVSKFVGPIYNTITYWAEPQCNCGMVGTRVPVKFTRDPGSTIGLQMTPASNPADLCVGESIKLSGTGSTPPTGASYEWRLGDPNKATPDFTGTDIFPTQSGTYYLKGVNSCGEWKGPVSITLNFKPLPASVVLNGPSTFCQADLTAQFTAAGSGYVAGWSISDSDPAANATISSSGLVTWNGIKTDAVVTMTVTGCHGTTYTPKTKTVTVNRSPYNLAISTTQVPFCQGTVATTLFNASGTNSSGYSGWSVSGAGNTISNTGVVTWASGFSGIATISALANGCGGSAVPFSAPFTVYANPIPTTTPASSVAIAFRTQSVKLTSSTGQSYQWLNNEGSAIAGANAVDFYASETGNYTVRITDTNGCSGTSLPVAVSRASNYNYVVETILLSDKNINGTTIAEADLRSLPFDKKQETVQFIDGLGRPMQSRSLQASPNLHKDIVQAVAYDDFGREELKYLPFVSTSGNGEYETGATATQAGAYNGTGKIASDATPFAKTVFESSPLSRTLKQGAPGADWQPNADPNSMTDHTIKKRYRFNLESEVYRFIYDQPTGQLGLSSVATDKYYAVSTLSANETYDEKNNRIIEFVDKQGQMICKKVQYGSATEFACTYYIYDDLGNLAVVLPPVAVDEIIKAQ